MINGIYIKKKHMCKCSLSVLKMFLLQFVENSDLTPALQGGLQITFVHYFSWHLSVRNGFPNCETWHLDGLVQERCNSIANTLELHLSCTNSSIWYSMWASVLSPVFVKVSAFIIFTLFFQISMLLCSVFAEAVLRNLVLILWLVCVDDKRLLGSVSL